MTQVEPGPTVAEGVTVALALEAGVTADNWGSVLVYCDEAAAPGFISVIARCWAVGGGAC